MKKCKSLGVIVAMTGCLLLSPSTGWAADKVDSNVQTIVEGKSTDQVSRLIGQTLYSPYALVADQLDAQATWDADQGTLTLTKGTTKITLSDRATSTTASYPTLQLVGDQVFVSVRAVFEAFDYKVIYTSATRSVTIQPSAPVISNPTPTATSDTYKSVSILTDLDPSTATGLRIEGVIANADNQVFTVEMGSKTLYRIAADTGQMNALTELPRSGTGMALDTDGNLYIASGGEEGLIYRINEEDLSSAAFDSSKVVTYASGVPGANGLAFDGSGNLYVSGGATGAIYKVSASGQVSTYASGILPTREEQKIVVNGIAFGTDGQLYVSNTSSGEVNRFAINSDGSLGQRQLVAQSPLLYGADGLNFGPDGAIYVAANERNAIVRVGLDGQVRDIASNNNNGPLEFPASLHFVGNTLYISNFDQPRGINNPNDPGIGASIATIDFS
ncbi:hypothetical protein PaeCFBP13512_21815 [Paenibacillus sp. CFBP13512]|uniref:SMP-30/gluconolactonase/LRE family protein n=1 Tax=Paenibacillus sp. CFBP13512 TaxID=2184007 RepID=UPI0010C0D8F8|nr:SMP-30/gluconolactonase/LRE family protein [Paenibacillus sp. CFBP13512]TKJ84120.1 hypothetical protein PaeCFBP13512_21815 [Paenibacillus sp. CFBP13512]